MKVAIIHYWLVNMRGGEKVIEALLDMYPEADLFTHVYDPDSVSDKIKKHRVYTSSVNRLPFSKKFYRLYMPLMPNALLGFNLQKYDLVISSESGPAKGVVPGPDAYHICYCHSPMRYLWDMYHEYSGKSGILTRIFMKTLIPKLRIWDITSSNLVDIFISNSDYVGARIRRYYNRSSITVFPPVNTEKYLAVSRNVKDYYLYFGEVTSYKKADLAIGACIKSGRKLVVAGAGASKKDIKLFTKTGLVIFKGRVSDREIKQLYSEAKALIFPGIEDFGIIPVEAQAAGCPVIAYNDGGARQTVKENITGLFFNEQTEASLIDALDRYESSIDIFTTRENFSDHVSQFGEQVFKDKIHRIVREKKRL